MQVSLGWVDTLLTDLFRHNVSKEFSLGLLEYESTKPVYDINQVSLVR